MIALDLDGTLLTTDKRLTEKTVEVLSQAALRGIYIVPATGRSITGLAPEVRDLPFVRYVITVNGAAVWDIKENRLISRCAFSSEQAEKIWDFIGQYHTMTDACVDGVSRMEPDYYRKVDEYMPDEPKRRMIRTTRVPTEHLRSWITDPEKHVEKFNIFFPVKREADRIRAREELRRFPFLEVSSSLGNNLEINLSDATKGRGLASLAAHLGVDRTQVMACGDGENDISMLVEAGIGVAMDNAPDCVKESADVVTLGNDQDGVAYAIEKWGFCNGN